MKYCKECRLLARDTQAHCRRCGKPLSELDPTRATCRQGEAEHVLGLQGKIRELEALQRRNVRRARLLAAVCIAVVATMLVTAYQVYARTVLSYALLDDVNVRQDDFEQNRIHVSFKVIEPGKVVFDRASGGHRTEKIDVFSQPGPVSLSWTWPSRESIDFRVVYRGGYTKTTRQRAFDVNENGRALDVVFLIDTTRSMRPFIDALKRKCTDFADVVRREGHDCRMGFVSFGDVDLNEPIHVFEPTDDVALFKSRVGELEVTGGGDEPESSVEALRRALDVKFRKRARPCFVHVTDAACHHEDQLPELSRKLRSGVIITYVVSLEENANLYARLCCNGGKFLRMENADFDGILDYIARALVSEIKYDGSPRPAS